MKTNLEIKKTYSINGKEFNSKEEAVKSIALAELSKIVEGGVDSVLQNSTDFLRLLKTVSSSKGTVVKGGSGTLKALNELLFENGDSIERDDFDWPVYHITVQNEKHTIRFTGKVWELYNLYIEGGIDSLLHYKIK
jgi:cell division ATPase FtsA